jgi:hypothetical protein
MVRANLGLGCVLRVGVRVRADYTLGLGHESYLLFPPLHVSLTPTPQQGVGVEFLQTLAQTARGRVLGIGWVSTKVGTIGVPRSQETPTSIRSP